MIRVLDSAGSTLVEWGRQQQQQLRGDMIQVFKIINGIDDINYEQFFEFTDYDGTGNSYENYIFNMLKHKVKNVLLVEDLHLFGILNYHN